MPPHNFSRNVFIYRIGISIHKSIHHVIIHSIAKRLRTKPQLNAPFNNPTKAVTKVVITDPRHPLFEREFSILSLTDQRFSSGQAYVAYHKNMRLKIPLSATNLNEIPLTSPAVKLEYSAVKELISLAQEYNILCPTVPKPSIQDCHQKSNLKSKTTSF